MVFLMVFFTMMIEGLFPLCDYAIFNMTLKIAAEEERQRVLHLEGILREAWMQQIITSIHISLART